MNAGYVSTEVIEGDDRLRVVEGTLTDGTKVYDVRVGTGSETVVFLLDSEQPALDLADAIRTTTGWEFYRELVKGSEVSQ